MPDVSRLEPLQEVGYFQGTEREHFPIVAQAGMIYAFAWSDKLKFRVLGRLVSLGLFGFLIFFARLRPFDDNVLTPVIADHAMEFHFVL